MYHYVRPDDPKLPHFRHLPIERFRQQLDYFAERHRFVSGDEMARAARDGRPVENGVVLTFDDGMTDHYEHVYPELKKRGIAGFFYVSTWPYRTGKMLDVHRIHMLLGAFGGEALWPVLRGKVTDEMLSHGHVREFREATYRRQNNDEATKCLKRTLNYYVDYRHRTRLLDELALEFFGNESELTSALYISEAQMREMQAGGMVIGSHAENHYCMSKLTPGEQRAEIRDSFEYLSGVLGSLPVKTFCYPYGGYHSFNATTETLLEEEGCLYSFNVDPRDIAAGDLRHRPQALPRYDCILFPHGHSGPARMEAAL
jgi:peptidoglycan/xylan/chitin deacetylase (PgdA/CDA1 family)